MNALCVLAGDSLVALAAPGFYSLTVGGLGPLGYGLDARVAGNTSNPVRMVG